MAWNPPPSSLPVYELEVFDGLLRLLSLRAIHVFGVPI